MPVVRLAARFPKLCRLCREQFIEFGTDLRIGELDVRTDEIIEQQVALHLARVAHATEIQTAFQPEFRTTRRRLSAVVGLKPGTPNDHVATLRDGIAEQKFVVPGFVTAQQQTRTIVALDEDANAVADTGRKPREFFEWRR